MYTVIHKLVLETHRREKVLLQTLDPVTRLPMCPNCNLPRLLEPPLAISQSSKNTTYCAHVPWSTKAGHDIYGNPFPVAGSDKPPTKKEREARLKAESTPTSKNGRNKDNGTPGSEAPNGTAPSSPGSEQVNTAGGPVDKKAAKVGERLKGGTYVPWHTCPSCKRSLLITRFAQHLEKCLGIGGRGAARAAARMNNAAAGSTGGGTPAGSRAGTPVPGSRKGDSVAGADDDENDDPKAGVRKKLLKRGLKQGAKQGTPTLPGPSSSAGNNSKPNNGKLSSVNKSRDGASEGKRERDDDDDQDATPLRKKQKMQRTGSTISMGTVSTQGDESVDGSFVNEDSADEEA